MRQSWCEQTLLQLLFFFCEWIYRGFPKKIVYQCNEQERKRTLQNGSITHAPTKNRIFVKHSEVNAQLCTNLPWPLVLINGNLCWLFLRIFRLLLHLAVPYWITTFIFFRFPCQCMLLFMHLTLPICFKTLVQRDGEDEDPFKDQYETAKCGNDAFLYHDRCFRFYDVRKTWAEAQKVCNDQEAVLVNTEDTFEGARLTYEAFLAGKHQKFWTGIKFDGVRTDFFFRCIC